MLGKGKAAAIREGNIAFSSLAKETDDPVYGKMFIETSLKDLNA